MNIPFEKIFGGALSSVEILEGGINNPTYKLVSTDGSCYILQFPGKKFPDKVLRQPLIVDMLIKKTILPVAKIIKVDSSCSIISKPYIISEFLSGSRLSAVSSSFSDAQIINLYTDIARLLSSLHSVQFDSFGSLIFNEDKISISPSFSSARDQIFEKYSSWIDDGLESPFAHFIPKLRSWLDLNVNVFDSNIIPCLIHNDFRDSNILVSEDGLISGIVDLDNVSSSTPVVDIYRIYPTFSGKKKSLALKTFFKHYALPLPSNFEKQITFFELTHVLAYFNCWQQIVESYTKEELRIMINKMNADIKHLISTSI